MSNDDDSPRGVRRNSGLLTAPPPTEPLPAFETAEMRAFDLAVALSKVGAPEDAAPPSLLVPTAPAVTSPPAQEAPTPVVRVGPSDIARLELDVFVEDHASSTEATNETVVETDSIFDAPFSDE